MDIRVGHTFINVTKDTAKRPISVGDSRSAGEDA